MSDKEIRLLEFINKKLDVLYHTNDKLKEAVKLDSCISKGLANNYCIGYDNAVKDFKVLILRILENKEVILDEFLQKESS